MSLDESFMKSEVEVLLNQGHTGGIKEFREKLSPTTREVVDSLITLGFREGFVAGFNYSYCTDRIVQEPVEFDINKSVLKPKCFGSPDNECFNPECVVKEWCHAEGK